MVGPRPLGRGRSVGLDRLSCVRRPSVLWICTDVACRWSHCSGRAHWRCRRWLPDPRSRARLLLCFSARAALQVSSRTEPVCCNALPCHSPAHSRVRRTRAPASSTQPSLAQDSLHGESSGVARGSSLQRRRAREDDFESPEPQRKPLRSARAGYSRCVHPSSCCADRVEPDAGQAQERCSERQA